MALGESTWPERMANAHAAGVRLPGQKRLDVESAEEPIDGGLKIILVTPLVARRAERREQGDAGGEHGKAKDLQAVEEFAVSRLPLIAARGGLFRAAFTFQMVENQQGNRIWRVAFDAIRRETANREVGGEASQRGSLAGLAIGQFGEERQGGWRLEPHRPVVP